MCDKNKIWGRKLQKNKARIGKLRYELQPVKMCLSIRLLTRLLYVNYEVFREFKICKNRIHSCSPLDRLSPFYSIRSQSLLFTFIVRTYNFKSLPFPQSIILDLNDLLSAGLRNLDIIVVF